MLTPTHQAIAQAVDVAIEDAGNIRDIRRGLDTDTDRDTAGRFLYAAERHFRHAAKELARAAKAGEPEPA